MSSVRRVKERGGGGGGGAKIVAAAPPSSPSRRFKSQKTLPENPHKENIACKKPTGKEAPGTGCRQNPAKTPVITGQKPAIRHPLQRIEKADSGKEGEIKIRRSTSALMKGKSLNHPDFTRILSDHRGHRLSRVSRSSAEAATVLEKCSVTEINRNDSDFPTNAGKIEAFNSVRVFKNPENKDLDDARVLDSPETAENLANAVRDFDNCKEKFSLDPKDALKKVENSVRVQGEDRDLDNCKGKPSIDSKETSKRVFDSVRVHDEDKGAQIVNKYPSKLHEKLAFLEGKVKRIASDIKKTKEMLDMNNPDASKSILSDIQDKISGIEKSMGHIIEKDKSGLSERENGTKSNCLSLQEVGEIDDGLSKLVTEKMIEKNQDSDVGLLGTSVKGLNHEELEARLFPHHKLLRNRPSLSNFATKDGSKEQNTISNVPNESLSPIDENPIALEFLASLKRTSLPHLRSKNGIVWKECSEVREMDSVACLQAENTATCVVSKVPRDGVDGKDDLGLCSDEKFDIDDQENKPDMLLCEETEDPLNEQLHEIGQKSSTGGWFVSEGESVLLAHADSSCSFYDIIHSEEKAEYKPPAGVSYNLWGDCWLIRAAGSDGCSGRYVVAASAGNTLDSGFCSWDYYTKEIRAFHLEDETVSSSSTTVLAPLRQRSTSRSNALSTILAPNNQQWWYRPCGPLLVSVATSQRAVNVYDIRDGDPVMKWEVQKPVMAMDYSSPLQWRNKGKVVIAETEAISLWDVNSTSPHPLLSVTSSSRKVTALHVNNTDAELGGGVRQRVSSSEAEGNDGVFCTHESIHVLDFRLPSGVGLKISKPGVNGQSIYTRGDSVFLGCIDSRLAAKGFPHSRVQQFSLRKGKLVCTYSLPESNTHFQHSSITQVWGSSNLVMGVCGRGLFVFDTVKDERMQSFYIDCAKTTEVREIIGADDLYSPSFDYLASRVLLISRDRPALWRYLS